MFEWGLRTNRTARTCNCDRFGGSAAESRELTDHAQNILCSREEIRHGC